MYRCIRKVLGLAKNAPTERPEILRATPSTLYMIGGRPDSDEREDACQFQEYSLKGKVWAVIDEFIPEARSAFEVTTYNDCIWVIGGKDGDGGITNTVFVYNPKATAGERWSSSTPMNHARHGLCAAVLEGKVYACGGTDAEGASDRVEVWNGKKWELGNPMVVKRTNFSMGVLRGHLYAVGGDEECRSLNFPVEVYIPDMDRWTAVGTRASQSIERGVGVAGNVLYSAGEARFSCLRRNVKGFHTWSIGPELPILIERFDVIVDCTHLYMLGGVPDNEGTTNFWRFNTTENDDTSIWFPMPSPLGSPRYDVKLALL